MQNKKESRVLVCPLNWGLGHATRCIPLIHSLQQQNIPVAIASDGRSLKLLQKNFPELPAFELPAYGISYPTANMAFNIFFKSPRILAAILREKYRMRQIMQEWPYTHVLSDNRFGCFHPEASNLFMTHQFYLPLQPATSINLLLMKKFERCWVPDYETSPPPLSGKLSHPAPDNMQVSYIGPLSQFDHNHHEQPQTKEEPELCLALISGPEPQRSKFENLLIEQIKNTSLKKKRWVIVGGKTENSEHQNLDKHLEYFSYLNGAALEKLIRRAGLVICRSGYTSLMDLLIMHKKALLIPTPGQDEQEYLANEFAERQGFLVCTQEEMDLSKHIPQLDKMPKPERIPSTLPALQEALKKWLNEKK